MLQEIALRIQAYHLAASPETGVDGHHPLLSHRSGQKELAEVLSEYADGFDIGLLLGLADDFSADGRLHEALEAVVDGVADFKTGLAGGVAVRLTPVVVELVAALFGIGIQAHVQSAFALCAKYCQKGMGRDFADRLGEGEITAVLGSLGVFLAFFRHLRDYPAGAENLPQGFTERGGFAHPFGNDVTGSLKGFFFACHLAFNVLAHLCSGVFSADDVFCKRLQPFCLRHRRARFPLGPIRKVQVLEFCAYKAVFNLLLKLFGEFPCFFYGAKDGSLALFHLVVHLCEMLDFLDIHVVQAAGALFAVAAYERHRAAVLKQFFAVFHLPRLHMQLCGYVLDIDFFHAFLNFRNLRPITPQKASPKIPPLILDVPFCLFTNTMGTSFTV